MGIDYGAKLAGTTAACWENREGLQIRISRKKEDADRFLEMLIRELAVTDLFIDAPLSLPGAYYDRSEDYFFREADLQLNAMSPMFLGGLTARAMKLRADLPGNRFYETYPRQLVRSLGIEEFYKKDLKMFMRELSGHIPLPVPEFDNNWHKVDSLLAWFSGYRFREGMSVCYGTPEEGRVWI